MGAGQWPPLLWMDSTTGLSKWVEAEVPTNIDRADAKAMRFMGWSDKIEYVRSMNFDIRWIPDSFNDFADLSSRLAELILEGAKKHRKARTMFPMRVALSTRDEFVPAGYSAYHLEMREEDWEKGKEAYMADRETMHSVTVGDLYRCVCMHGEGVASEIILKVRPWNGRTLFCSEASKYREFNDIYTEQSTEGALEARRY